MRRVSMAAAAFAVALTLSACGFGDDPTISAGGLPEIKDIASEIKAAQGPEIETMNKMAVAWGVDLNASSDAGGGGHGAGMGDDTAALEPLSGKDFDREFLTRMTAHHEGALEMAKRELAAAVNPQAKALASAIVESQSNEIADMKSLLAVL